MKILLMNLKSNRGSFHGKFYNEPLRKADKKGLKIVRTSHKEGLESVRSKAIIKDEKEGFRSWNHPHTFMMELTPC
jgi:hypothetical protein